MTVYAPSAGGGVSVSIALASQKKALHEQEGTLLFPHFI